MSERTDEYRRNAEVTRRQAERSANEVDKARCLKIAELWLRLAKELDDAEKANRR